MMLFHVQCKFLANEMYIICSDLLKLDSRTKSNAIKFQILKYDKIRLEDKVVLILPLDTKYMS